MFSVIIPALNEKAYMAQTFQSIDSRAASTSLEEVRHADL
jgi:glycosyltransferase involved in cell wall biosynthesis